MTVSVKVGAKDTVRRLRLAQEFVESADEAGIPDAAKATVEIGTLRALLVIIGTLEHSLLEARQ